MGSVKTKKDLVFDIELKVRVTKGSTTDEIVSELIEIMKSIRDRPNVFQVYFSVSVRMLY